HSLHGRILAVECIRHDVYAPPARELLLGQRHREKHDDQAECKAKIHTSRGEVVVIVPPAAEAAADEVVEDQADDHPGDVRQRGRGRDETHAAEDERRGDVAHLALGEHARQRVEEARHATRADDAEDDRGVEGAAAGRADEAVSVPGLADAVNGPEGPFHDGDVDNASPNGGDELGGQHGAGRDLHVMAELQVLGEEETLIHRGIAVGLEQHHRDGAAGEHKADNELGDDVETDLEVGHSLQDADGNHEDEWQKHGNYQAPNRQAGIVHWRG
ncbi:hypothetical protein V490_07934, partial [Pseudogymnoascus sp. VKM F-3557]